MRTILQGSGLLGIAIVLIDSLLSTRRRAAIYRGERHAVIAYAAHVSLSLSSDNKCTQMHRTRFLPDYRTTISPEQASHESELWLDRSRHSAVYGVSERCTWRSATIDIMARRALRRVRSDALFYLILHTFLTLYIFIVLS